MSTQPTDSAKKTSSNDFNRQVGLYSLAAAAAGVSLLALAQPAQSEVVITKKTIPILANQPGLGIDLNHDGLNDLVFYFSATQPIAGGLRVAAFNGSVIGYSTFASEFNGAYASALMRGAKIGQQFT